MRSYLVDLLRQLIEVSWGGPVPRHVVVLPEDVAPRGVEAEGAQDQHEVRPLETLQCHQDTKLKISATSMIHIFRSNQFGEFPRLVGQYRS